MASVEECKACLVRFENKFHGEIFTWINHKLEKAEKRAADVDALDISTDDCSFGKLLMDTLKLKRMVTAVRGSQELSVAGVEVKHITGLANDNLEELKSLGQFDMILLKEMTHEVEELAVFFETLRSMLKDENGRIFLLCHPKNPPVPVPDPAMPFWRKLSPNREEIIKTAKQILMGQSCYSASCPIKIEKFEWANIIRLRYFPAVKKAEKCTDKEIRDFVNSKSSKFFEFEEKMLIFVLTPKPLPGQETEDEQMDGAPKPPEAAPPMALAGGRREDATSGQPEAAPVQQQQQTIGQPEATAEHQQQPTTGQPEAAPVHQPPAIGQPEATAEQQQIPQGQPEVHAEPLPSADQPEAQEDFPAGRRGTIIEPFHINPADDPDKPSEAPEQPPQPEASS